MNQVVDFSTLSWVKKELDETLKEARQSLETYVENPKDRAQLGFLSAYLHQVYGTLKMVELHGASLLAREMEKVTKAISEDSVIRHDDACENLMRAILQLPDYLERLVSGGSDIPLVLLPVLNDLRAVRGKNPLSQSFLFSPDLDVELPAVVTDRNNDGDLQKQAVDLRHRFQLGLLGWFKGENTQDALASMAEVLGCLQRISASDHAARLWWVAAGLADALKEKAVENSVAIKRLMGQVDREIKCVTDHGETALEQGVAEELFRELLFYVGQARGSSQRVADIQSTYRLRDILPGEEELAAARESLTGQNSDLFDSVAIAVKEELTRLKDSLDIVLRNGCSNLEELEPLIVSLRSLGGTLGMLGLDAPRTSVFTKADDLQHYVDSGEVPADTLLMDVASILLLVESSVEDMGSGRAVAHSEAMLEDNLAESEFSQVMDVVMQEAITDLTRAKEAIVLYTEEDCDSGRLGEVPQLFCQLKGGLELVGEIRAAALIDSISRYIEGDLLQQNRQPPQHELESLAEAVCGLEYYLEGRMEHRIYGGTAMAMAEESVDKLGYPAQESDLQDTGAAPDDSASRDSELPDIVSVENAQPEENKGDGEAPVESTGERSLSRIDSLSGEAEQQQGMVADELLSEQTEASVEDPVAAMEHVEHDMEVVSEQPVEESDGLAIIGEDVDEDILEIFIEEADEEIASIHEQLAAWIEDPEDTEALGTVRRSYHTLKGSGRLLGAMRIGEFAWACENLLNRLIDGTVAPGPTISDFLQSASGALPELVQQVKDNTPTQQPIAHLMQCADALSSSEDMPLTGPAHVQPSADAVAQQGNDMDMEAEREDDKLALPLEQAGSEVEASAQVDETTEAMAEEAVCDSVMDPTLYDIFNTETRGHVEVIRRFLEQKPVGEAKVDEQLARAVHTLHGSARMAEAEAIADLAGELERWTKALMAAGKGLSEEGCRALEQCTEIIEQILSSLPHAISKPEEYEVLLNQVRSLYEAIPVFSAEKTLGEIADDESKQVQTDAEDDAYSECDEELLDIFLEEGSENLEASDSALQRWRESGGDGGIVDELKRSLHTLKGGARMAGLGPIADLAHAVESLITTSVEVDGTVGEEAMDALQHAQDNLAHMLDSVRARQAIEMADSLIARLDGLKEQLAAAEAEMHQEEPDVTRYQETDTVAEQHETSAEPEQLTEPVWRDPYAETDPELLEVFLQEAGDIMEHTEQTLRAWKRAPDDHSLMAELQRELHTLKGGARMTDITDVGDLAHAVESLMVRVSGGEIGASESMFAVLQEAHDSLTGMIDLVRKHQPLTAASAILSSLELLCEGGEAAVHTETAKSAAVMDEHEETVQAVAVDGDTEHRERRASPRSSQELVRVKSRLLDNMVNYAGEVSIYRSRLEQQIGAYRFNLVEMDQTVSRVREQLRKLEIETEAQVLFRYEQEGELENEDFDPLEMDRYSHIQQLSRSMTESISDLSSIQNLLENITRESETLLLQQSRVNTELQEGLMRTRMVPFTSLAARLRRIVRQTAQELGKKVELELSGAEGEMDRTVVDRVIAPVEHMLRNAISHGIEMPEQRREAGKPESGTIRILLDRESSDVVLRIVDDGAGMNLAAIRSKAIERGMMDADSELSDNDALQFILETGFSTAEKVTQVAGRGVGMDVVNSEVKQLGGSLHIDSESGKGTSFTVRLPFTLALNQALLVEVGEDTYAVPLASIEGVVRMHLEDLNVYYDNPDARFSYGGSDYEVRHLCSLLGTGKPRLDSVAKQIPLLLARVGDQGVAMQIDNLLGSREIVVKSVGPQISAVKGVAGATILGDGSVVMILDVAEMLRGGASLAMAQVEELIQQPTRDNTVTVMVVDDSITVRKVTSRLLERNDMNVITAKDGVDAVSKLQDNIPDIMLLDIEMPRMDGFELATHVRNEARLRNIPIIMITSRTGDKHRQRAMQIGVNRYLGKPFQEAGLMESIRAMLEEQNVNG